MQYPIDLVLDAAGNIYVADGSNNRVQKFNSSGTFVTKFGGTYGS
jgi:DNA-binding beta-propeller fold protein YncE